MGKATMKRTGQADGNAFNWTNGERSSFKARGGLLEINSMPDARDGRVRLDIYQADRGTRVTFGGTGTDAYGVVTNRVLGALWNAEQTEDGTRDVAVTEDDYRWAVLASLGVCKITGRVDCAERSCELHYMDAPLKLAPDIDRSHYEGSQIARVLDCGPEKATGGAYKVKLSGEGAESKWLSVTQDQVYGLAGVLGATTEAPAETGKREATREHLEADLRAAKRRRQNLDELIRTVTALNLDAQRDECEASNRLAD